MAHELGYLHRPQVEVLRVIIGAVLAIVERDYAIRPRRKAVHLLTAGDAHVHCCGEEIADLPTGDRTTLNPHGVTCQGPS